MKINRTISYNLWCVLICLLLFSTPSNALDTKYNRNGEVYFLIGEQNESGKPNPFKGIYRMNNPETNVPYPSGGVRYIKDIDNTIGFTVDLDRYIYPFTENIPLTATQEPYIYRQVVDTASCDHVDYGLHAYFHDDYRNFNKGTDIYRSNVGRNANGKIRNVSLNKFKSLGPGEYVGDESNLPEGYVYIEGSGNGRVVKQPNKAWYKIRNNRWYSCWKQGNTTGAFGGKFYWTVGDQEWSKIHKFMVNKWGPGAGFTELAQDKYTEIAAGKTQVGQTWEISVTRYCRAGCLDSCGNANGSGSGSAPTASASVAFQPAPTGSTTGNRAYFYTRVSGSNNYSLKYNGTKYPEGLIIGYPKDLTTFWIGVSLKGVNDDFVYALGTNVIKDWYHAYTNSYQHNMKIMATAVSNQWEQKGGIVFAYDKTNDIIYKFVRNDKAGLGTVDYEAISCSDLASKIGSVNTSLDDIKADGFGSLYFALSYPAKSATDGYDPTKYFKQKDAEHMCLIDITNEGNYVCDVLFRQKYSKVIFKRDYLSGVISEVGRRDYAYKVYSITITVPKPVYDQLKDLSWPNDMWYTNIIKTAYDADVAKYNYSVGGYEPTSKSLQSKYFALGRDQCKHAPWPMYETFNEENPGQTQLAVINVPTPPEVRHLGPYKVSYLDICGPYDSLPLPPVPNNERITNQNPPTSNSSNLQPSKIYFYMVENYPLEDGAQDPTLTPDCDNDTRLGGFISSISDPKTGENGGAVHYEWKLWLVEDPFKNKCCELYDQETNGSYSFPFWYYSGSKFILTCRVRYNWYDYDRLDFGDTVDKKDDVLMTNCYAWPSDLGGSYDMATASVRLNEIMNTSAFSFMKPSNNPKDVEGNDIDYISTILENDGHKEFWAMEPIVVDGIASPPEGVTLTASLERCDHIYKTNGTAVPNPGSYLFKTGAASHWSLPEASTNCFTIETGKTFYWRMAIASQAKLFCDISNSTKIDASRINDEDFNMVAYLLSTQYINGVENKNYVNTNPNLQFYPSEAGSCWWRQKKKDDGTLLPPEVKVQALLKYKLPDGTIRQIPLHDLSGTGAPITVELQTGESTLWQKNKPLYATMSSELDVPPTDPFIGTLSVELSRQYYFKMWILNNDGVRMKDIKVGPLTLALTAESSIRVLDTDRPTIVYNETSPINLYGLTGRPLAANYAGESKTNPPNVAFAISDNNAWEATGETGLSTLYKHVENYMYNFGVSACEKYTKGSSILEGYYNTAKGVLGGSWKGIRKDIEDAMNSESKSSHLNMRPLYCKFARDTRFVFDTSVRNLDGSIAYGRGDSFKYNSGTKQYTKDDELFDGDNCNYAYNPGIKTSSNLTLLPPTTVDDGGNKFHAVMKYTMALANIKLRNGVNMVPEGYANNTPGYTPYQFYVRSTDCSGNYTFVNKLDNKIDGYMPLNMALHVRDDIPPIPYGSVKEFKGGNEYVFPQEKSDIASSTSSPLAFSIVNTSGASAYPEYFGMDFGTDFLRKRVWSADNNDTGYLKDDPSNSYKSLLSFCGSAASPNDLTIANGDTVKGKANFISQLKKGVSPYYVEDNVECLFKVYSTDNAGDSVATLSFKYYTTDNPASEDSLIGSAWCNFKSPGVTTSGTVASSSLDASAMFRGPRDKYPFAIPIIIVAEDNAKDWDEYLGYSANPSDPTKASSIWGTLRPGANKPNQRIFLTTLAVFYSGLDVRLLEKTLKNN